MDTGKGYIGLLFVHEIRRDCRTMQPLIMHKDGIKPDGSCAQPVTAKWGRF